MVLSFSSRRGAYWDTRDETAESYTHPDFQLKLKNVFRIETQKALKALK